MVAGNLFALSFSAFSGLSVTFNYLLTEINTMDGSCGRVLWMNAQLQFSSNDSKLHVQSYPWRVPAIACLCFPYFPLWIRSCNLDINTSASGRPF